MRERIVMFPLQTVAVCFFMPVSVRPREVDVQMDIDDHETPTSENTRSSRRFGAAFRLPETEAAAGATGFDPFAASADGVDDADLYN
ncbi:hypothetical protein HanPSC8_Chr06g0234421 [Helianthus annuus]|nr:hypothetical protein HanPSC8_Chr06g0234421 [Helianthus annuus]